MANQELKHIRFFRLYNSIQVRLYSYLLTVVHNRTDAEDLLQETAIFLWERFDQFEEGTSFGAWAIRISQYKALEFMRRNKKTRIVFDDDFYNKVSLCSLQSSSDVSEREEALRSCIKKLPE
ncbi:sigma-70 family RNA polymerase sigma factor, partial [Planctomycetota bacterium]